MELNQEAVGQRGIMESLFWYDAKQIKPDATITVLVFDATADDPVWMGYWDDDVEEWYSVHHMTLENVTHWAELPRGPQ